MGLEKKKRRSGDEDLDRASEPRTLFCLKVSEAKLRALVGDEELSVQGENHGLVLHVDHATDHVALFPRVSEVAASCVHAPALREGKQDCC